MTDHDTLVAANVTIHDRIDPEVAALVKRLRDRLDGGDRDDE